MASYDELLQKMVNTDYSDLVSLARESVKELLPYCKEVDTKYEGVIMLTFVVLTAVAADGVLTGMERQFLHDVLGLTEENIDKCVKMYNDELDDLVDKFADSLNDDAKASLVLLVIAFTACDEKISRDENAFIRKLID